MAGEDRHVWCFLFQHSIVVSQARHIPSTHLDGDDLRDPGHRDHLIQRIARFGPGRVLVHDDGHIGTLGNVLKKPYRSLGTTAKAQPVVRRHQQYGIGASLFGSQGVVNSLKAALRTDSRDDLDFVADLVGKNPGHAHALSSPQAHHLARMTVAHQALDAIHAGEITCIGTQTTFVNAVILFERAKSGCKDTAPGMFVHESSPFVAAE